MTLEALAHPNCSDDDVRIIWGPDNVRVRPLREIKDFGYVCLRKLGLENENTARGEDSGRALNTLRGGLGSTLSRSQRRRGRAGTGVL
jgi:hypothetical protein